MTLNPLVRLHDWLRGHTSAVEEAAEPVIIPQKILKHITFQAILMKEETCTGVTGSYVEQPEIEDSATAKKPTVQEDISKFKIH